QPPQLLGSVLRLISQPSVALLLQLPKPALHAVTTHVPIVQAEAVTFGRMTQETLQPPQLFGSVFSWVSQPSAGLPLQLPKPGAQAVMEHIPPMQAPPTVLGRPRQDSPHAPQLFGSCCALISQPLAGFMSQSLKPPKHIPVTQ